MHPNKQQNIQQLTSKHPNSAFAYSPESQQRKKTASFYQGPTIAVNWQSLELLASKDISIKAQFIHTQGSLGFSQMKFCVACYHWPVRDW